MVVPVTAAMVEPAAEVPPAQAVVVAVYLLAGEQSSRPSANQSLRRRALKVSLQCESNCTALTVAKCQPLSYKDI